jgi:hypothetical protein
MSLQGRRERPVRAPELPPIPGAAPFWIRKDRVPDQRTRMKIERHLALTPGIRQSFRKPRELEPSACGYAAMFRLGSPRTANPLPRLHLFLFGRVGFQGRRLAVQKLGHNPISPRFHLPSKSEAKAVPLSGLLWENRPIHGGFCNGSSSMESDVRWGIVWKSSPGVPADKPANSFLSAWVFQLGNWLRKIPAERVVHYNNMAVL